MNIDEIIRQNDEIIAETDAIICRGEELLAKLEIGEIKPGNPMVKEVIQQLIERRRIGAEFNTKLQLLVKHQK